MHHSHCQSGKRNHFATNAVTPRVVAKGVGRCIIAITSLGRAIVLLTNAGIGIGAPLVAELSLHVSVDVSENASAPVVELGGIQVNTPAAAVVSSSRILHCLAALNQAIILEDTVRGLEGGSKLGILGFVVCKDYCMANHLARHQHTYGRPDQI